MEIEHCLFPDDLLYDPEENVWVRVAYDVIVVGISCIYAFMAGRLQTVKIKQVGIEIEGGRAVATVESPRFFG